MPDPIKKVRAGDPFAGNISYRTWNELLEIIQWYRAQKQSRDGGPPDMVFDPTIGLVQNTTSNPTPRFSVLSVSNPIIDPGSNQNGFAQSIALTGAAPTYLSGSSGPPANPGQFVITLEVINPSSIGRCVLMGACPCYLDVGTTTDQYAEVTGESSLCLATAPFGSAQILWKDSSPASPQPSGAPHTLYWGIVRLGNLLPQPTDRYQVFTPIDDTLVPIWTTARFE